MSMLSSMYMERKNQLNDNTKTKIKTTTDVMTVIYGNDVFFTLSSSSLSDTYISKCIYIF